MPQISFLLGAGFSFPAKYPLASGINALFSKLREGDFTIHTSGYAFFHNGNPNPNDHFMRKDQRVFAEKILKYYCQVVLNEPSTFHYEKFYDWYKDLLEQKVDKGEMEKIVKELGINLLNSLAEFDRSFNQLLAQPLTKWYPEVHLAKGLPRSHSRFLDLVESLSTLGFTMQFHTLNHDLFFESLSSTDALRGELADGFSEMGSPFYGVYEQVVERENDYSDSYSYLVRLRQFTNSYNSRFNLYKLHGSVDHYLFQGSETIKIKRGIGALDIRKEVEVQRELKYQEDISNYYPSFLSGTTYKLLKYNSTHYYNTIFRHFKRNLESSEALVVIGYGFADSEINKMIEENYLKTEGRRVFIIDINEPNWSPSSSDKKRFYSGGVEEFDFEALQSDLAGARSTSE